MTHMLTIAFVLLMIGGPSRASEIDLTSFPQHGTPAFRLDERISVEMRDQILWRFSFMPNKGLTHGVIYYEHPRLQEPKMRRISLSMSSVTVREALDALVEADGSYSWVSDGDVVNFMPKKRNKKFMDPVRILNQVIPVFDVENVDIGGAVQELKIQAAAQGIRGLVPPQENWKSLLDPAWERDGIFSLKLRDKTVRECLNAIIAADVPAYWEAMPLKDYVFIGAVPAHIHTSRLRKQPEK